VRPRPSRDVVAEASEAAEVVAGGEVAVLAAATPK
jgi:hypothetical protein